MTNENRLVDDYRKYVTVITNTGTELNESCPIPGLEKETLTRARKSVDRLAPRSTRRADYRRRRRHRHFGKFIEKGGADLIIIYNSGRFRMAGHGSTCGLMAYGDANAIAMEIGEYEVLPWWKKCR